MVSTSELSSPVSVCGSPLLRALKPVEIQPQWRYEMPNISSPLLRIERLEVVRATTQSAKAQDVSYAINVYFQQPHSRIPTCNAMMQRKSLHAAAMAKQRSGQPDLQILHTMAEFGSLRDHIHTCAQTGHRGSPCGFCEQLTDFLSFGGARPMAFASAMFSASSDASALLTGLLAHLLEQCQELLDSGRRENCRGQRHIPYLLYLFIYQSH